jgi:hypothetical protein
MRIAKLSAAVVFVVAAAFVIAATRNSRPITNEQDKLGAPRYTADKQLVMPKDYREWIYLSSGLGMTYNSADSENPSFGNVFVNPAAYRSFLQAGIWPDKTVFMLEIRSSTSKGSINKGGRFQTDVVGIEAEVKDSGGSPGKWTFYGFGGSGDLGTAFPPSANCYSCHRDNGAVDNTFVQFYPTLIPIATAKGTFHKTEN